MIRFSKRYYVIMILCGYILLQVISGAVWRENTGLNLALQLPTSGFSFVVLLMAGLKAEGARYRRFWLYLSAGSLFYFMAMSVWCWYVWIAGIEPPIPSVADFLWNGQTFMFLIAIFQLMAAGNNMIPRIRYGFDTMLLMLILALMSWEFLIEPYHNVLLENGSWLRLLSSAIYPVSDLAITCVLLMILNAYRLLFPIRIQILIAAGFLSLVIADTVYFFLIASDSYQIGHWVDALYSSALLILGLAAVYAQDSGHSKDSCLFEMSPDTNGFWRLRFLFPNLCMVLLVVLIAHHLKSFDISVAGSLIVLLLIVIRQVMVVFENRELMNQQAALWKEAEFLARHDSLSMLPNRRYFENRLNDEILKSARVKEKLFAVLFLDLDRFKIVNDSLGHVVGDQLILAVAERLRGLSDERHFVARLGGDEYTFLITNLRSIGELESFMDNLHRTIEANYHIGSHTISISTSIGASVCPTHGMNATDLMKRADLAMYKAKSMGTGKGLIFTHAMEREYAEKAVMEQELHNALERSEFSLHYQPQVRAYDGRMIGIEALIRWKSDTGFISPGEFIPLAEETGIILPIGEWVLRTACLQSKEWMDEGVDPFCLSVNVSPLQFEQGNFVQRVREILAETGFPPHLLILEITENIAIRDGEDTIARLIALKKTGVQISMDDFGTGYSSLHYLQRFRVDGLKIAQSFISGITDTREQGAIVKAILAMASSLQLTVVAEGVETEAQYMFLKEQGCDVIQGYYFYKPMPAEDMKTVFDDRKRKVPAS
jgi:diguanylate cyclase